MRANSHGAGAGYAVDTRGELGGRCSHEGDARLPHTQRRGECDVVATMAGLAPLEPRGPAPGSRTLPARYAARSGTGGGSDQQSTKDRSAVADRNDSESNGTAAGHRRDERGQCSVWGGTQPVSRPTSGGSAAD